MPSAECWARPCQPEPEVQFCRGELSKWIRVTGRPDVDFQGYLAAVRYPWLTESLAERLARAHGARIVRVLGDASRKEDLGVEIVPGVHEPELRYLRREEWATTAEDVLWRRSKLGLHLSTTERLKVALWMEQPWRLDVP